jgi:DNA-binding CsgD family transcriptional regulator/PAS domain-containing protein
MALADDRDNRHRSRTGNNFPLPDALPPRRGVELSVEMTSKGSILLRPHCPDPDDPDIIALLDLAAARTGASWITLDLRIESAARQSYRNGTIDGEGHPISISADGFEATIRVGSSTEPDDHLARMLSFSLEKILMCRRYHQQVALLRGALDTTTSALFLFDRRGNIVYANPRADQLLSRQTQDGLVVEIGERTGTPLVTFLCSKVDKVVTSQPDDEPWTGTLALSDGSLLACEILRVEVTYPAMTTGVLALLQPVPALSKLCLESFCARHRLSPREEDVVTLLLQGLTTVDMADQLGISAHTVRDHLKRLYRKTGARSRSELLSLVSTAGAPPTVTSL